MQRSGDSRRAVDPQGGTEQSSSVETPMTAGAPVRPEVSARLPGSGRRPSPRGASGGLERLLLAACILAAGTARAGFAQATPAARLAEIRVFGSNRYAEEEIIRATELKPGMQVTPQAFQDAADRLAATGAFSDVNYTYSATPAGVSVQFRLADGSDFAACNLDNLVWFNEKELRAELKRMIPLFGEQIPVQGDIPAKIEAVLTHFLKEKGIPGTVTIMGAGELGGTLRAVQFNVTGVRLTVQQVEFSGAQSVEPTALIAAIQPLLGAEYDPVSFPALVQQHVGPPYWQRGFLKVAIGTPRVEILPGSTQDLAANIPIVEGARYNLEEILWSGNEVIPSAELAAHIHVAPGQPADTTQLEKDMEEIQDAYAAKGYLTARARFQVAFDEVAKTVIVDVHIREGNRYSLGKLEIAGIDPVRAEALKKASELAPGQPYNRGYWNTFISKSGRLLPASRTGWKTSLKEDIHEGSKSVDVTLTFLEE